MKFAPARGVELVMDCGPDDRMYERDTSVRDRCEYVQVAEQ